MLIYAVRDNSSPPVCCRPIRRQIYLRVFEYTDPKKLLVFIVFTSFHLFWFGDVDLETNQEFLIKF